jgi:hypothetical protein
MMKLPRRCIVTFGIAPRYAPPLPSVVRVFEAALKQLRASVSEHGFDGELIVWDKVYPEGCPPHRKSPFAFKPFCVEDAMLRGFETILWMDASVRVKAPLGRVFERIEKEGYLLFREDHSVGEYCTDAALRPLGITREESFRLPSCWACVMGFNMRQERTREFLQQWQGLAMDGVTFPGPKWSGVRGFPRTASADERVKGHRWDQTAASVLALKFGMNDWQSKDVFSECFENDRATTRARVGGAPLH